MRGDIELMGVPLVPPPSPPTRENPESRYGLLCNSNNYYHNKYMDVIQPEIKQVWLADDPSGWQENYTHFTNGVMKLKIQDTK